MSGTINLAFTQQFDAEGVPLSGGLLYFFTAGTTTPQSAFQDTGLTIEHPNPVVLDASGRVPMFYLSDGFIKIRLTDDSGVVIIAADQLLVIGPSSGGGGGGSAGDVTAALQTGDIKARYDTAVKDGFVRLNGRTIGNIGSSATERQEAVCQPLFEYLWPFPNITLDGFAKGINALADWGNGRRLILPDLRGRTIAGLDDMGATAASRLTSTYFGAAATTLGNVGGLENHLLTTAQLASHAHGGTIGDQSVDHSHTVTGSTGGESASHSHPITVVSGTVSAGTGGGAAFSTTGPSVTEGNSSGHTHTVSGSTNSVSTTSHSHSFTGSSQGGDAAHPIVQPSMVLTFYMKM